MFKIRKEQMDAQHKAVRESFEDRLIEFLCGEFPEAKEAPPEKLRLAVREQIDHALGYGLSEERYVAVYLVTAWLLGQKFDTEFPAAQEILTSKMRSSAMKAEDLQKLTERLFVALEEEG